MEPQGPVKHTQVSQWETLGKKRDEGCLNK